MKRTSFIAIAAFVLISALAFAGEKILVNRNEDGVALQGYDAVAFFTDNKPVKGKPEIQSIYKGARYYFATTEHKQLFDGDPAKYEPQFGGFCAYGVSQGHTVPIEIDAFQIVIGRLLMQYDKGIRDRFNKDTQGNLKKADSNWPGLVEKQGR